MSEPSPVDTVTTPVLPRPARRPSRRDAADERRRLEQLVEVVAADDAGGAERGVGRRGRRRRASRCAAIAAAWACGLRPTFTARIGLSIASARSASARNRSGRLKPSTNSTIESVARVVEAGGQVVADVEDDLGAAADDPAPADPRPGVDERVRDAPGLGDADGAAATERRWQVVDVGRARRVQVDDAHAVRAEERRCPASSGDLGDLGLHPRRRLAALDDAAARDDHRGHAGRGRLAHDRRGARSGFTRDDDDVGHLGQRREVRVARAPVDLVVARVHEVAARRAADPGMLSRMIRARGRERGDAPTMAIERGAKSGREVDRARVAGLAHRRRSSDDPVDAPALERARDDQALDLARALPDPIDAQLAEVALRRVLAHVAASAEDLDDAIRTGERRLRGEQLGERRLGVDDLADPRPSRRARPPRG